MQHFGFTALLEDSIFGQNWMHRRDVRQRHHCFANLLSANVIHQLQTHLVNFMGMLSVHESQKFQPAKNCGAAAWMYSNKTAIDLEKGALSDSIAYCTPEVHN